MSEGHKYNTAIYKRKKPQYRLILWKLDPQFYF